MTIPTIERRTLGSAELRAGADGENQLVELRGHAALFRSPSEDLGGGWGTLIESIGENAFDGRLGDDVRHLFNHDANFVLGRNTSGTLRLSIDERGLFTATEPPATQWANDLMVSIKRGDVNQMSFAFTVADDEFRYDREADIVYRTILRLGRLYDVSTVTYPAYPDTRVVVSERALARAKEVRAIGSPRVHAVRRVMQRQLDLA